MSGGLTDVQTDEHGDYEAIANQAEGAKSMFLIHVKFIQGVLTEPQKREMVEQLTDAVVATAGENLRQTTWCLLEEVPAGGWSVAGQAVTPDDVRALARTGAVEDSDVADDV
jgi:4-oxalocrotonate tautomerase